MILDEEDYLAHYGILRKSGRYPYGSGGDNPEQRSKTFLDYVDDLKRRLGWGDVEIARHLEISTTDLRALRAIAKNEHKAAQIAMAQGLKDAGNSNVAIGQRMGLNESSVRALLAPGATTKADVLTSTTNMLREHVAEKKYLDVGSGTENYLGVSKERKDIAVAMLKEEGYTVHYVKVPQLGTNEDTLVKVLAAPGTTSSEVFKNRDQIRSITKYSEDGGRSWYGIVDPLPVNPKRISVVYGPDGGSKADGVIYVREGVEDLSLGGSRYAQVRIKVGENHYLKGMAMYKADMPEGVDLVFNTNKSDTGDKTDAFKKLTDDPDNPFGSYIKRQILAKDKDGNDYPTSAMNLVNEEGKWNEWSRSLSSQVLSKQSRELAKRQLAVTKERRQKELDEIMALTNPAVRKKLLEEFADGTDVAAVHMKAAALPRQRTQVILPIDTLPDTQVYAPNFRDGERVALIRYPHGGTFEIPELTVNNKHSDSRRSLGQATDAIGINTKVAARLSGADFDGDTVLVIPNNQGRIRSSPALRELQGFDPKHEYPAYDGMRTIDGGHWDASTGTVNYRGGRPDPTRKNAEMGDISNLITDMTIQGAPHSEIARAVRHSMAVIDSEKHSLNYKLSAERNGIRALKEKYQGRGNAGAATLISRAKSPVRVAERIPRRASKGGPVDPVTGKRVYEYTGRTYVNRAGVEVPSVTRSRRLAEVDDANLLSSGHPMERIYAAHSNELKAMANRARLESISTPRPLYSSSAAKTYAPQVQALNAKLELVVRNRPRERQALVLANALLRQKRDANPNMDADTLKKIKFQALEEARRRTGAHRIRIEITPDEWDAIQAGAISPTKLTAILQSADMDSVRALATPRAALLMSPGNLNRALSMAASGATRAEIADQLGVSLTTLEDALREESSE